jgi:predicted PurR-regulated permease PerM
MMDDLLKPAEHVASEPPPKLFAEKPLNMTAVYLGGIFFLSLFAACYVAAEFVLPICVAFILNLVFSPAMRSMRRLPRSLGAMIIILGLLGGLGALGTALSGPAAEWGEKLPSALPKIQERLRILTRPVANIQKTVSQAESVAGSGDPNTVLVDVKHSGLTDKLFSSTRVLFGGIFEMLLVLFFLLISGETFQQRFIEMLPRFQDKKNALSISHQIERDISAYLRTITVMNLAVGTFTALIMYCTGVGDCVLWGTVAFLLNYVPIIGPIIAVGIYAIAGMLSIDTLPFALVPAGLYFAVHLTESQLITPMILSRRFTLNPALVVLALIFWYWMWGVAGAILATPMLAILKIICDRITPLKPLGHFIES